MRLYTFFTQSGAHKHPLLDVEKFERSGPNYPDLVMDSLPNYMWAIDPQIVAGLAGDVHRRGDQDQQAREVQLR
jgi:hypothetical protein